MHRIVLKTDEFDAAGFSFHPNEFVPRLLFFLSFSILKNSSPGSLEFVETLPRIRLAGFIMPVSVVLFFLPKMLFSLLLQGVTFGCASMFI